MRDREVRALAAGGGGEGARLFNDLAEAACRVRPELAAIRAEASRLTGMPAHVTGSGSGLFVACGVGEGAEIEGALRGALRGVAVRVCRLI